MLARERHHPGAIGGKCRCSQYRQRQRATARQDIPALPSDVADAQGCRADRNALGRRIDEHIGSRIVQCDRGAIGHPLSLAAMPA